MNKIESLLGKKPRDMTVTELLDKVHSLRLSRVREAKLRPRQTSDQKKKAEFIKYINAHPEAFINKAAQLEAIRRVEASGGEVAEPTAGEGKG